MPSCAAYTYYYDDLDQLVLTIDGNDFKTFTKYDKLGRPVITGRYKGNAIPTRSGIVFEEKSSTAPHYYTTNQAFPTDGDIDIYTVNYYDDYYINRDNTEEIAYEADAITNTNYPNYPFVRGMPTGSKVAILKNDATAPTTYLNAYTFYDKFRRVLHSRKDNHLGGQDKVWSNYNFPGWLKASKRIHNTDIAGQITTKTIKERWEHDPIGRVLEYHHEIEGDQAEKQICENIYNERDELATKKIGNTTGTNFLQTIDYSYNIRKWLTAINDLENLGSDLFGMEINYTSAQNFGDPINYNGNIGSIVWKNSSDGTAKQYAYEYDALNRLRAANYSLAGNSSSLTTETDRYSANYTYDRNGNIIRLNRNGLQTNGTFDRIDSLSYTYADDGALTSLEEKSEKNSGFKSKMEDGTGAYTYDGNGNLISDEHKGMTIDVNHLNLVTKVTKPEGTIEWIYDATGTKLSKIVTTEHLEINDNPILSKEYQAQQTITSQGTVPNQGNTTFTAGDSITLKAGFTATAGSDFLARIMPTMPTEIREYCGGIEYLDSNVEAVYFDGGRVFYAESGSERQFVLADYQGNVRSLFKEGENGVAQEIEKYSYYAFGAVHQQQSDYQNKYLYGGKELHTELDLAWSDFGTRCFDNWKAKWEGIDIMAEASPQASPYGYTLGNPVRFSDPTGMLTEDANGLITVSTSLRGRDYTGGENTGKVLQKNFVSEGQLARDMTTYSIGGSGDPPIDGGTLPTAEITANRLPNMVLRDETLGAAPGFTQVLPNAGITKILQYALGTSAVGAILYSSSANSKTEPIGVLPYYDDIGDSTIPFPITLTDDGYQTYEDDFGYITLFRGVGTDHPGYPNALIGMAVPRGGHSDPIRHALGDTESIFTSWTRIPTEANKWASYDGPGGVILIKQFHISQLVPSPNFKPGEGEFLVPFVVNGAKPVSAF